MDAGQIVELVSNIAVMGASAAAIYGLNVWRQEFMGKRRIELAEEVLCLFYRADRAIEAIRFPLWDLREGQTREAQANETPEQKEARDRANVVFKRIRDNSSTFDELHALRFRFMARFGRDKAKPFDDLRTIVNEIWVAAEELAQLWEKQLRARGVSESVEEDIKEFSRIIWSHGKNDETVGRLRVTVENIENMCRPIIDGQTSRFSRLWRRAPAEEGQARS